MDGCVFCSFVGHFSSNISEAILYCPSRLLVTHGQCLSCAWKCAVNSSKTIPKAFPEGNFIRKRCHCHQNPSGTSQLWSHNIKCSSPVRVVPAHRLNNLDEINYDMGRQHNQRLNMSLSHNHLTLITKVWRQGSPPSQSVSTKGK